MRRAAARRALVLALATAIAAHARASAAATDEPLLPPDREVAAVLSQSPAWRAASQSIGTEQETHRQALTGPHEWVGSVGVAQRQIRDASPDNTIEWEAGLERTLRRPGKRDAADRLGGSRVELARGMRSLPWRGQARALLARYGSGLRGREAARVWVEQVALLQAQADAVAKRQRLGDAARIEQVQVEAAVAQAQAQAVVAEGRAQAARESGVKAAGRAIGSDAGIGTPSSAFPHGSTRSPKWGLCEKILLPQAVFHRPFSPLTLC